MARSSECNCQMRQGPGSVNRGRHAVTFAMLAMLAFAIGAVAWAGVRGLAGPDAQPSSPPHAMASFDPLLGDWAREDGDYTIRIRRVASDGNVEAAYLNPSPIHVAQAKASRDGDSLNLFVKMQDVGYPGSKYDLTYRAGDDILIGTYFQAVAQETYPIVFHRRGGR